MEYNTAQPPLILREYGRNVQKLVEYVRSIPEKEKRNASAETLIELMKQVTPTVKETPETSQKLWDDMYIMANFDIDIDSPYPIPEEEILTKKPRRLEYVQQHVKFRHYGKNIELLIQQAVNKEDPQ